MENKSLKLEELAVKITDGAHHSPKDFKNGFPMLSVKDMRENGFDLKNCKRISEEDFKKLISSGCKPEIDDILIAKDGSVLKHIFRVKEEANYVLLSSIAIVRPNKEIVEPEFLAYSIKNPVTKELILNNYLGGTGVPRIVLKDFKKIDFELPPLPEQKAIASVLSSLDDKIDLLHQQNQTLEALAETLFRQWFIEEAKEDWEELPFSEWINETVGGDWGKETLQGEFTKEVYCIRGTDIADLLIGIPTKTPIRFVKEKKFQSIEPKEGDIIIEISGGTENQSTGRAYFINNEIKSLFGKDLVFSNFCRLIRIKDSNYSFFVYLYLKYLYDQDEFFNLENGSSGIKNLDYKSLLFENKYKMPKEDLVLKFNDLVSDSYKKINHNKFQIQTLTQLRDTLLPKLMSGDVRVKN